MLNSTFGAIKEIPKYSSLQADCLAEEEEDDDDMFSLSDFPTHRDTSNNDDEDLLAEDQSFEFFNTEKWNNTNIDNPFPPENIIFCGNIIPSKKPITGNTPTHNQIEEREYTRPFKKPQLTNIKPLLVEEKRINNRKKGGGTLAHNVSILRSSTKWHIYTLGMANKVPMEMELNDIRSRQNRRPISPNRLKLVGRSTGDDCSSNEKVSIGCSSRGGKGLWGLIRDFGCHDHTTTMVKASLVCIRRV